MNNTKVYGSSLAGYDLIYPWKLSFTTVYVTPADLTLSTRIYIIAEIAYTLLTVPFIFRTRFSNIIGLMILEGTDTKTSFKILLPIFSLIGILPLVIFFIYYYTYGIYWYPLYIAYGLILGLLSLFFFSLSTEYYTLERAYKDQSKFLKMREIE
ncbi:hypothetical protein SJAV_21420 [Sulfurisphaera javensis]|uniref:Uncharacterized protein n=1 Tax=Sulfurisphaera javensis TaxID=2049879 RepID=A0AAT9GTR0_9CREN